MIRRPFVSRLEVFVRGANPFVPAAVDAVIAAGTALSLIRTERYGQ